MDLFDIKDGEFIVIRGWIFIYSGYGEPRLVREEYKHPILMHALGRTDECYIRVYYDRPSFGIGCIEDEENKDARYATNTEKEKFLEELEKKAYTKWNFKDKELESLI